MKTGTLKELNVKPGDVVECVACDQPSFIGDIATIRDDGSAKIKGCSGIFDPRLDEAFSRKFRLISRASDAPTLWRDMTDAEKGALLLAAHEGKVVEVWVVDHHASWWGEKAVSYWRDHLAYRVRPEPKLETVTLHGSCKWNWSFVDGKNGIPTHRITFDTLDGEPVCDSIRMEPVK